MSRFSGGALNEVGLGKNDSVVVSSEDGRYIALSTGFIKQLTENVVEVVVDRWALCFVTKARRNWLPGTNLFLSCDLKRIILLREVIHT